jgi:hypothetical protein
MRRTAAISLLLVTVALVLVASGAVALSGDYTLDWWTMDGGGATFSENGGYTLGSTIGQPDASVWQGQEYDLLGGFWGGALVEYRVYLPLVLRDY